METGRILAMTAGEPRPCWQNCAGADDEEVRLIDAMEDSLGPLNEQTIRIRRLITLFEACYHEADREAADFPTQARACRIVTP